MYNIFDNGKCPMCLDVPIFKCYIGLLSKVKKRIVGGV